MTVMVAQRLGNASTSEQRVVAGHLLRLGLMRVFGIDASDLGLERDAFGKPRLRGRADVHFNVAHCPRAVTVMLSGRPVGVDVEAVRARDPYVAARCFDASERGRIEAAADPDREFFRYWTLKESYVKALGCGLAYPLRDVRVEVSRDGEPELDAYGAQSALVEDVDDVVIALCWLGRGGRVVPSDLVRVEW